MPPESLPPKRFPPDDPREWLNRAKSSLARSSIVPDASEIYLEDLCFDAQQAAEKAIKAVLLQRNAPFPYTHDLAQLLSLAERAGLVIPQPVRMASSLTGYAVEARYPGFSEPVTKEEHEEAVAMARTVVRWAEQVITQVPALVDAHE